LFDYATHCWLDFEGRQTWVSLSVRLPVCGSASRPSMIDDLQTTSPAAREQ
jgi:hypothetical protein